MILLIIKTLGFHVPRKQYRTISFMITCWTQGSLLNSDTKITPGASSLLWFFFFNFNWRLITLQYCSGFCHTLTWISRGCTCVPHPKNQIPQLPTAWVPPAPGTKCKPSLSLASYLEYALRTGIWLHVCPFLLPGVWRLRCEHTECWKGCMLPSARLSPAPAGPPLPVYLAINSVFCRFTPIPTLTLLLIHVLNSSPQCDGVRR